MFKSLLVDTQTITMTVILVVLIALVVVFYVMSSKKRKKQEQDAQDLINAVKPGNKVKTIGGICGIVVEVDNEENTFVLETGTELSGKCYIKFDRQAIYQTDAVVAKDDKAGEDKLITVSDEVAQAEAAAEKPATEAPAEEAHKAEEPAEKPAMTKSKKRSAKSSEGEEKQVKF